MNGILSNDSATVYTNTTNIVGGTTYKIRVNALNKYGWSGWGTVFTCRCASQPAQPPSISTTNSSTYIQIFWTAPFNNGLNITAYKIEIQKKSGASWLTSSECDGSQAAVFQAMSCQILMTTFRATSTFNYVYNDIPTIRVSAGNLEGFGPTLSTSGGAAIQTEPISPPVLITNDLTQTNDN